MRSPLFFQKRLAKENAQTTLTTQTLLPVVIFHYSTQNQINQSSPDSLRIQGQSKRSSSGLLHPASPVKVCYRKGGKCKMSCVLQSPLLVPKPPQRWRPVIDRSRLNVFLLGSNQRFKWKHQDLTVRLHQFLDDWLTKVLSREEAQVNSQIVVDLTQSLGWIINQETTNLNPTQVFFICGLYHLDLALVNALKRDGSNFKIWSYA